MVDMAMVTADMATIIVDTAMETADMATIMVDTAMETADMATITVDTAMVAADTEEVTAIQNIQVQVTVTKVIPRVTQQGLHTATKATVDGTNYFAQIPFYE